MLTSTAIESLLRFDSWGKLLSTSGSLASTLGKNNPFRYRGYVYDEETGFYYLQSRYYNPEVGRFISSDVLLSTGQGVIGHNAYAYCGNNPVNRIDPSGQFWITALIVTAVVAVCTVTFQVALLNLPLMLVQQSHTLICREAMLLHRQTVMLTQSVLHLMGNRAGQVGVSPRNGTM